MRVLPRIQMPGFIKPQLATLISKAPSGDWLHEIKYDGYHLTGDGQEMFEHAAKLNWEGIVSKRADAPYKSERNESWVKIKTVKTDKFPVVGFVKDTRS